MRQSWIRVLVEYFVSSAAARVVAAISGLLVVRNCTKDEYAFLTLLLTLFTFATVFSDLGLTESLGYFYSKRRNMEARFPIYFLHIRRLRFFLLGLALLGCAGYYVAFVDSFQLSKTKLITGFVLVSIASLAVTFSSIDFYALKLHQRFRAVYLAEILSEGLKAIVIVFTILLFHLDAIVTMASTTIAVTAAALLALSVRRNVFREATHKVAGLLIGFGKRARFACRNVLPVAPALLHFSLQGLIVSWLALLAGGANVLAEIGALSRLGALIGAFAGAVTSVVIPRLSNATDEKAFRNQFYLALVYAALASGMLIIVTVLFPETLLLLLGKTYMHLRIETVVAVGTAVLWLLNGLFFGVNRLKGWLSHQVFLLPLLVAAQVLFVLLAPITSTLQVLLFSLMTSAIWLIVQICGAWIGLRKKTT